MQSAYAARTRQDLRAVARTGGVTAIQRFGSGMNLHVHFHALVVDGAFVHREPRPPDFVHALRWSARDVAFVLADLVGRLVRAGFIAFEADVRTDMETLAEREPLGVVSTLLRIALGPRRGQRVERTGASPQARALRAAHVELDPQRPKARYAGFDLDASVRIGQHDRRAL